MHKVLEVGEKVNGQGGGDQEGQEGGQGQSAAVAPQEPSVHQRGAANVQQGQDGHKVAGLVGVEAAAQGQSGEGKGRQAVRVQRPGQGGKGQRGEKGHQDRLHADAAKADVPVEDGQHQGRGQARQPATKELAAEVPGQRHGEQPDEGRGQAYDPGLLPQEPEGQGDQVDGYGLLAHVLLKE